MLRFIVNNTRNTIGFRTNQFHTKSDSFKSFITPSLSAFLDDLHEKHNREHKNVLDLRREVFDKNIYSYRSDTKHIRKERWTAGDIPKQLQRRHVELTGPGNNAKMVIHAMNSNANGYMFDIEDSMSPRFENVIAAHKNLIHLTNNNLEVNQSNNKYIINNNTCPTLFVRTRGLHMFEQHIVNDENTPIQATLFDIGTHLFNNGKKLYESGRGPYLYIPKLESYEDAIYVENIISSSEEMIGIPKNSTKVTALIETFPAIYQTDEIIYAMRDRITGLNCGRWDYLFSMIKCLNGKYIFPDRELLTMNQPFMEAYVKQIVNSCHKRGIHAMGGMSAFIPSKNKGENQKIVEQILQDKNIEISRGCDGAWVAHPDLIDPIKTLFEEKLGDHQINSYKEQKGCHLVEPSSLRQLSKNTETQFTEKTLRNNIRVILQYLAAWLHGNGAVGINNIMEDLATAEISAIQIKNWLTHEIHLKGCSHDDNIHDLIESVLEEEYQNILVASEVDYAREYLPDARSILRSYLKENCHFLGLIAKKRLDGQSNKQVSSFTPIKFEQKTLDLLGGSQKYLSGVELTKYRGNFLNRFLYHENNDAYKFLGTSNGVSAVNVVAGGKGKVGPYSGGWQANAMKNRLGMNLPDTLHVAVEDVSECAAEINYHLEKADQVQHINQHNNENYDFNCSVNYYDVAVLADLEQGWSIPEKTRIAVKKAIENGVNVIHIEDQGVAKRCGHLGDKELATYEDYAVIMRSANLAAQELLGIEQCEKQWVRFVARTDAYSAKRIHNSSLLEDPSNPEHKFVDWGRGTSIDGKYLFLKQGTNPETGNLWGLDLSISRSTRIVDDGLASHVWMETPDADLQVARTYLHSVNNNLETVGKKAYGLYNHSPSFDWDVKFFADAKPLTEILVEFVEDESRVYSNSLMDPIDFNKMNPLLDKSYRSVLEEVIKKFFDTHGSEVQGDQHFTDENIKLITQNAVDYMRGEDIWRKHLEGMLNDTDTYMNYEIKRKINDELKSGFKPKNNITEIIVDQRLNNFSRMLASFGFDMHLITLPEFHVTAFNMHKLANKFPDMGINAFVRNTQRPERIYSVEDPTYTYYKHQSATGTGVEAAFNTAVGSADVNTLSDSTEADDLKKRS